MDRRASKDKYFDKIKPVMRKNKFSQLNMDDVARYMDISKATLYKYFSSKDEIITMFVEHCIDYLRHGNVQILDDSRSFIERFQNVYEQSLKSVVYMPDILLQDLKEIYPQLFDNLVNSQHERIKSLETFFTSGAAQGIFHPVNASLFLVQDDVMFRRILEPSFTIQFDLTLKKALMDFYMLKKYQLLTVDALSEADDSRMEQEITRILQQIS